MATQGTQTAESGNHWNSQQLQIALAAAHHHAQRGGRKLHLARADRDDLRVALTNHFDAKPDLDQVKVWLFQDDAAPREVTEDVIDADFTDDGDDEFDHWISRRPFHAYSEAAE